MPSTESETYPVDVASDPTGNPPSREICLLQLDLKLFPNESADPESSSESECLLSFGFVCGGCFRFLEQFAKPLVTADIIFRIKCFFLVRCCDLGRFVSISLLVFFVLGALPILSESCVP